MLEVSEVALRPSEQGARALAMKQRSEIDARPDMYAVAARCERWT